MQNAALLSLAITPKTTADQKNLARGLQKLMGEDPTIRVKTDEATGEVIIGATGEVHLEIIVGRLKQEFGVEAALGRPQVAYKETITRAVDGEVKYARQIAGRGHYAHLKIHLSPVVPGSGYAFENNAGASIPAEFIKPIEDGIKEALTQGVLAGYPMDDVRVELYDGSYHQIDSSKMAFKTAGWMAFQDAARKATPVLLEPVMRVEIRVSPQHKDDVIGNLSSRRGQIQSEEVLNGVLMIDAHVPLAEMSGYSCDLRERTQGRGTFAMQFDHYQPCPPPPDDDRDSLVGSLRKPLHPLRHSAIALPEPSESDEDDHVC